MKTWREFKTFNDGEDLRLIEYGAITELQSEIEKLKAELDAAKLTIENFKNGVEIFRCFNCHGNTSPLYNVNLMTENEQLREQADKLADAIDYHLSGMADYKCELNEALEQYKKWKAGK